MTEQKPNFWQDHSTRFLEMAFGFERRERMTRPDGCGKKTGDCGDTVEIFLAVEEGRIRRAQFEIDGCQNTHAAANAACHLAEGKTVDRAWRITPETVAAYLETLPEASLHCAELAVGALYLALADSREVGRQSWKKPYR